MYFLGGAQKDRRIDTVLLSTHNICLYGDCENLILKASNTTASDDKFCDILLHFYEEKRLVISFIYHTFFGF